MNEYEKLLMMDKIYSKLMDEESKNIFKLKCEFMVYHNCLAFWNAIKDGKEWRWPAFTDKEYIIFGAGMMGSYISNILLSCGRCVKFFVDNSSSKIGRSINGIPVLEIEAVLKHEDMLIILSDRRFDREMRRQLADMGVSPERVISEPEVCAFTGMQYFDIFEPVEDEVFIDGGAYGGETVKNYIDWCKGNYKKIFCFEPDKENMQKCGKYLKVNKIPRVKLIQKGLGDDEKELLFNAVGTGGSSFTEDGSVKVPVTSIDHVLEDYSISKLYIKMDIEGSEMNALAGATRTIKKYKPRLAICVYHKEFDFVNIPLYLLELNPEYKFYMRHYASNMCETVLYAE